MSESLAHKILNNKGLSWLALDDEQREIELAVNGIPAKRRDVRPVNFKLKPLQEN